MAASKMWDTAGSTVPLEPRTEMAPFPTLYTGSTVDDFRGRVIIFANVKDATVSWHPNLTGLQKMSEDFF